VIVAGLRKEKQNQFVML